MLEKGKIAEGKRIPKLFSGTMQNMQRTVTFSGELSAYKRNDYATDMLTRIRGFFHARLERLVMQFINYFKRQKLLLRKERKK